MATPRGAGSRSRAQKARSASQAPHGQAAPPPAYQHPPVAEVAIGVYFQPLTGLKSVHIGGLAKVWAKRFPQVDDQPPLAPVPVEAPLSTPMVLPPFQIQFGGQLPSPRVVFQSAAGERQLQIQRDRIVCNWRLVADTDPYPHYHVLREEFAQIFREFGAFASRNNVGLAKPLQTEVTYVNPVPLNSLGGRADLSSLLVPWSGERADDFLPEAEETRVAVRFPIKVQDAWRGSLYVNALPASSVSATDQRTLILLQVFARTRVTSDGAEAVMEAMDLGHDWAVRGFASLTELRVQTEIWRRSDA
ncbi:MAG: TIGR04255 family protein [Candidatus Dormibacteria bacterium]